MPKLLTPAERRKYQNDRATAFRERLYHDVEAAGEHVKRKIRDRRWYSHTEILMKSNVKRTAVLSQVMKLLIEKNEVELEMRRKNCGPSVSREPIARWYRLKSHVIVIRDLVKAEQTHKGETTKRRRKRADTDDALATELMKKTLGDGSWWTRHSLLTKGELRRPHRLDTIVERMRTDGLIETEEVPIHRYERRFRHEMSYRIRLTTSQNAKQTTNVSISDYRK